MLLRNSARRSLAKNFHISEYPFSSIFNHDPDRPKKLLLHKEEIKRLQRKTEEKGFTLIPLDVYLKNGLVKIKIGLCKGKNNLINVQTFVIAMLNVIYSGNFAKGWTARKWIRELEHWKKQSVSFFFVHCSMYCSHKLMILRRLLFCCI